MSIERAPTTRRTRSDGGSLQNDFSIAAPRIGDRRETPRERPLMPEGPTHFQTVCRRMHALRAPRSAICGCECLITGGAASVGTPAMQYSVAASSVGQQVAAASLRVMVNFVFETPNSRVIRSRSVSFELRTWETIQAPSPRKEPHEAEQRAPSQSFERSQVERERERDVSYKRPVARASTFGEFPTMLLSRRRLAARGGSRSPFASASTPNPQRQGRDFCVS